MKKSEPLKWFCAVKSTGNIAAKSFKLAEAQKSLGIGSKNARQAIIPMTGSKAGDPHTLDKKWQGGSMWWWNWPDIKKMQAFCEKTSVPGKIDFKLFMTEPRHKNFIGMW